MTTDEAKAFFALMNWEWTPMPIGRGNNVRGRMPTAWAEQYSVFVNEVMVESKDHWPRDTILPAEYERHDLDRCLTHYANTYAAYVAGEPLEWRHAKRQRA